MVTWSQDKHIGLWEATEAAGISPVRKEERDLCSGDSCLWWFTGDSQEVRSCEPESKGGERAFWKSPRFPAVCSREKTNYSSALLSFPKSRGTPRAASLLLHPTFPSPTACLQWKGSRDEIMEQRDYSLISALLYSGNLCLGGDYGSATGAARNYHSDGLQNSWYPPFGKDALLRCLLHAASSTPFHVTHGEGTCRKPS